MPSFPQFIKTIYAKNFHSSELSQKGNVYEHLADVTKEYNRRPPILALRSCQKELQLHNFSLCDRMNIGTTKARPNNDTSHCSYESYCDKFKQIIATCCHL